MADSAHIAQLRLLVGPGVLTDPEIGQIIDTQNSDEPNLTLALAQVWEAIAGRYSGLVNVSESGSSRSMSDLHKNALAMAAATRAQLSADVIVSSSSKSGTRKITRI